MTIAKCVLSGILVSLVIKVLSTNEMIENYLVNTSDVAHVKMEVQSPQQGREPFNIILKKYSNNRKRVSNKRMQTFDEETTMNLFATQHKLTILLEDEKLQKKPLISSTLWLQQ